MSTKTFPSTGEKPKFNPNAAYEAVQETPVPKGNKPAFNPDQKFEAVKEDQAPQQASVQQPAFQVQLSEPTFKSAPAKTGAREFTYTKETKPLGIYQLHGKARVAQDALNKELQNNKLALGRVVAGDRLKEQEKNRQAGIVQSPQDYKLFITDEDLNKISEEAKADRNRANQVLNASMQINPEKSKGILKNIYTIAAFNSAANDPNGNERVNKIEENAKAIEKGDLLYEHNKNILIKPEGFFSSLFEARKELNKISDAYDVTKTMQDNGNVAGIISELNTKLKDDPDEPHRMPQGMLGELGHMLGGQTIKGLAAGGVAAVGTTLLGNPEAAGAAFQLASGAMNAVDMYKIGKQNALEQSYRMLKSEYPDMPDFDAYTKANDLAEKQAVNDAAAAGAMQYFGAKVGFSAAKQLGKGLANGLSQIKDELGKKAFEAAGIGGIGAASQVVKNIMAQQSGINIPTMEGALDTFKSGVLMTGAMAMLGAAFNQLKPGTRNRLSYGLGQMSDEAIDNGLNKLQQSGQLTPEQIENVRNVIKEQKTFEQLIPENLPETDRINIGAKIKERSALKQKLEQVDEAFHPEIKEKIKKLNEEIISISKGEDRGELQSLVHKAIQDNGIPGIAAEPLRHASEGELKKYMKEIAEQVYAGNESSAIEAFGENIVNKAKELYPDSKESSVSVTYPKKSGTETTVDGVTVIKPEIEQTKGVSVIQPGELKHPDIINIKSQEDAIPVGSTETVSLGETPGDSQPVVEGISKPGEVAGTQEIGGQAEAQNNATGQEGVGEPPLPPLESKGAHAERPDTQLSFHGLQDTANEFGFEDVRPRDSKTDLQTSVNAQKTANEWAAKGEYQKNIDDLLGKIDRKEMVPTDEQRLILEQYLANEKQKGRELPKTSPEYDKQLAKIKRIKEIGEKARSEAGAALRLPDEGSRVHPINDEIDAMAAKMEANKVDKLTDQQKADVETQVEKHKKAADEANAKVAALKKQVAKLDAEKEFKKTKSTTRRVKKTIEERQAFRKSEVDAAREALRKLRSGESGLSAVPLPGIRELMAIAPHVKNIMVDLVAQGVDNLQDVVKHLHTEFKDILDVTEKNVHDIIAGEYNEKGTPITELQRQIRDLQDEAKLINQVESLENGVAPKTEKAKRERNQKIKALRDKIKELKAGDGAEELNAIKKRNEAQTKKLKDKIEKGEFEKETKKSIFDREDIKQRHPQLRKEALDAIAKKEDAQHEFDLALFNDEMKQRKWYQKAGSFGAKLIHTSKAVLSGIDDSATFVQNGLAMLANPKLGAKVWLEHWKDAFSNARFKRELSALHERPDWEVIKKSGLDIVEPHSAASKQVEEAFEQNLLAEIKIKGIKPWDYTGGIFERAFTSMGNNMRLALFEKQMAALKDAGKTYESHPQEFKDAARVINELTGRGKLPSGIAQASPYITPFVWAPRMLTSTINTLGLGEVMGLRGKGYYQNLTPMQRKFALSQLSRGIGIGVGVMGAAALGGAKVDYDPRSVTFGDVIMGDHHINVFGRYTPVVKALVQFTMGERVKKDGVQDLDSGKFGAKTRMGIVGGFFRGKMTPAAGVVYDLAEHKNYFTNKPFGIKDLPEALLQPMSVKELREGWKNDGTWTILNRFLPAFEGLKTSDERDFNKKEESKSSNPHSKATRTKRTNPHHQKH